jgi:hypothetical protein
MNGNNVVVVSKLLFLLLLLLCYSSFSFNSKVIVTKICFIKEVYTKYLLELLFGIIG